MSTNAPRSLKDIPWQAMGREKYTASPAAWEDQVLYFLMLDRFSDGREQGYRDVAGNVVAGGTTPSFDFTADAYSADRAAWADAGIGWLGGTLKGLESKIGYLKRLGMTTLWISPVFKQVASDVHSYHGYGIQDFLDVDSHFGSRQDLIELVDAAHAQGIRVILDIILNHAGDVFGYRDDGHPRYQDGVTYPVAGWRNAYGEANIPFGPLEAAGAWPNDAVWPAEFQRSGTFSAQGRIQHWDDDPEYRAGDFESLKDIGHGPSASGPDGYHPAPALHALCQVYKYWIALTDVDGFRIDTVKHMEIDATRYFASVIKEYAQSLGKENFFLVGEITGGRENAWKTLELTGLDAALGIDEIPDKLDYLAKGWRQPEDYFNLFRNSVQERKSSHVWFGKHVVTLFDDHDQVRKGQDKGRFCGDRINDGYAHLKAVLGLNLTTMGIPCLYYGTEQAFDGAGKSDRYLRECMFGGLFGSLQSKGRHFFNEDHEIYRFIADVAALRARYLALSRGRQYLRQISDSGEPGRFALPRMMGGQMLSVVPWSRLFADQEILLAINTDAQQPRTAWVTVDAALHADSAVLTCLYSTDPAQIGGSAPIEARNGKAVRISVPPGGFVAYGRASD